VPKWTYVTDVFASPREVNTVFVALNNWQRGDFNPYLVKSTDRGRNWTSITGDLPPKHDVWSVIQDHENGDLLFAGTEFGLFASFDGGDRWTELKGGLPPAQIRDMTVQRRENDLVLATFGRGFYVLDDYSPLREMNQETLAADAHLFSLRDAYLFNSTGLSPAGSASIADLSGNFTTPNPPDGAVFTYHVTVEPQPEESLVLLIKDASGGQVREIELDSSPGLRRVEWDLRGEAPQAGQGAAAPAGGGAFGGGGFGGRARRGPLVEPGRYQASIGWKVGDDVVEIGKAQSFHVVGVQW
jgi:hypothetical protein